MNLELKRIHSDGSRFYLHLIFFTIFLECKSADSIFFLESGAFFVVQRYGGLPILILGLPVFSLEKKMQGKNESRLPVVTLTRMSAASPWALLGSS